MKLALSVSKALHRDDDAWLVLATIDWPRPSFARERLTLVCESEQEALALAGELLATFDAAVPERRGDRAAAPANGHAWSAEAGDALQAAPLPATRDARRRS